uniref:Uncharacterized protein n=1 Tax=Anguilla anguilla TaxID=7936 RepID=A0A0E9XNE8_ANGAN
MGGDFCTTKPQAFLTTPLKCHKQ